ncbi:MAG: diguanylate cyclase [Gallionellaceae bacterium]|nr:diguanylate cyclase [Gallionellaceae bacterium]
MRSRFVSILMFFWLAVLAASLLWNWHQVDVSVRELARTVAKSHFEKDLLFRRWVAMHGGVYVPPTAATPPNPHLAFLKARDVITTTGQMLTLVNPAYMTRQVYELAASENGVQGHITSLKPLRPENRPDAWERQVLLAFESGAKEMATLETVAGQPYLRYMHGMITEAPCLKCHEAQGYKVGDVRGGISVTVPFAPYVRIAEAQHRSLLLGHLGIGFLGLAGLWLGGSRLRRSEERMQQSIDDAELLAAKEDLLLASLGEGVYGVDRGGKCIFINPAALAMLGLAKEAVIGRDQHVLFHSRRLDGAPYPHEQCPVYQTLQDGRLRKTEDAFLRDDQLFPVYLSVTPMLNNDAIVGAVVVFQDLSERKQAELEYKTILQTATDGYLIVDAEGRFLDSNDAYCAMLGYDRSELLRMRVVDVDAIESPEEQRHHTEEIRSQGHVLFESRRRRKDGRIIDVEISATYLDIKGGLLIAFIRDISERKQTEQQIRQLAYYDTLTNLPNRRLLLDRFDHALVQARRFQRSLAVMFLDLDRFKQVNDTLGHEAGDELLKQVAKRLLACVRAGDTVARPGGDEFVILLAEIAQPQDAALVAEKVLASFAEPVPVQGKMIRITTSIGIAVYPIKGPDDIQELMKKADLAMYEAKEAGRNGYRFFDEAPAA